MPAVRSRPGLRLWLAVVGCAALAACAGATPVAGPGPMIAGPAGAVTYCGWDGQGHCASIGQAAKTEPAPQVVGADTEVSLDGLFTNDIVVAANSGPVHGGFGGEAFDAATFPSSGTMTIRVEGHHQLSFLIPAYGAGIKSAISLATPVTMAVPSGTYTTAWLLEAGHDGNLGPVPLGITYADGTSGSVTATFADWCNGGLGMSDAPPDAVAISVSGVLAPLSAPDASDAAIAAAAGASDTVGATPAFSGPLLPLAANCGLWAERVDLPAAPAPITALVLPARASAAQPEAFVMALTLEGSGG